jgi:hypothetical protein
MAYAIMLAIGSASSIAGRCRRPSADAGGPATPAVPSLGATDLPKRLSFLAYGACLRGR